jgi:hypothetical protein
LLRKKEGRKEKKKKQRDEDRSWGALENLSNFGVEQRAVHKLIQLEKKESCTADCGYREK